MHLSKCSKIRNNKEIVLNSFFDKRNREKREYGYKILEYQKKSEKFDKNKQIN